MDSVEHLTFFMQQYPWLNYLMLSMVAARLIFKPIFTILAKYVELTVEMEEDHWLKRFMESKLYKLICFTLDLTLSVKLVELKKDK